jgi:drug/metabolite transporter (DMT)-like permease
LPIVWLVDPPKLFPANLWPFFLIVAAIELFYSYPYFKALQNDDTSVAISLFSLSDAFVPVMAFLFIGELLRPMQYFGFFLIVAAGMALTFNFKQKFKFNKSFFYMLSSAILLAVEVIIYKYIFTEVGWGTGYVWAMGISAIMAILALIPLLNRTETKTELSALKQHYPVVLLVGCVSFLGGLGFSFAIHAVSATVARSISSFQPFFVLLYAVMFKRFFPLAFKEQTDSGSIAKKVLLFITTIIGVILTVK